MTPADPSDTHDAGSSRAQPIETDRALRWLHHAGAEAELLGQVAQRINRRRRRRVMAVAAAGMIGVLGTLAWRDAVTAPTQERAQLVAITSTTAAVLKPRLETLPDGSTVEFRDGAEITHDFSGHVRRVTLARGEAHFQVAKNPDRPFVVQAGAVEVRAVGTAFAVQLGPDAVEVLVTEGRVALGKSNSVGPSASLVTAALSGPVPTSLSPESPPSSLPILEVGHRAIIPLGDVAPAITSLPTPAIAQRLAWRVPQLEFSRAPLADVVELMNRHAAEHGRKQIVIAEDSRDLRDVKLSGFLAADNTDGLVRLLEGNFKIHAVHTDDRITLWRGLSRAR